MAAETALALDFRIPARRWSGPDDESDWALETMQADLRRVVDVAQLGVPTVLAALQRDVRVAGLARPGNDVETAIVNILARMGPKLGPELAFDLSERDLAERLGVGQETASRKIEARKAAGTIELVDPHEGNKARRWQVGTVWLRAALDGVHDEAASGFSPSSGHTTTPISSSSSEGSAPARGEDAPLQQESESDASAVAVVRLEDGDYGAPDVFTPGQAQQRGLNDSARRAVVALRAGPLSPGELARHIGCHPNTATRVLDRLEARGMIMRTRRRVELVPEAVERASKATRRRDYLRHVHRGEREAYAAMLERQRAAAEGERLAQANREARRRGLVGHEASAFKQPPAPVEPPPQEPEARATARVPVAQPVEIQQPSATAARSSLPDPKVSEPTTPSRTIVPVVDIAALRAWEQKHPDVTRNGARPAPDVRRRRSEQKPPTCKHGEPRGECGRCVYADRDMGATTLDGRPAKRREVITC